MRAHRVRALLMGGQACVFYGAAEFSRDADFAILADATNLGRLRRALADLQAELIAVPPFGLSFLRRGHALRFRCQHPEALRVRVDIMARMRGVDAFPELWRRLTVLALPDGTQYGRADPTRIRFLEDELTGYVRLRVGGHRVIFAEASVRGARQIQCLFAGPRSTVYEAFAELVLDELSAG